MNVRAPNLLNLIDISCFNHTAHVCGICCILKFQSSDILILISIESPKRKYLQYFKLRIDPSWISDEDKAILWLSERYIFLFSVKSWKTLIIKRRSSHYNPTGSSKMSLVLPIVLLVYRLQLIKQNLKYQKYWETSYMLLYLGFPFFPSIPIDWMNKLYFNLKL